MAEAAAIVIDDDDLPGDPPPKGTVKPAPAPKAKVEPDPEPEAPKKFTHSSLLVRKATEAGFTQADLDNFPSEAIWEELDRVTSIARAQPKAAVKAEPKAEPVDPDEAYLAELETTHAPLVKILRQAKKDREELLATKEEVNGLKQSEVKRQQAAFDRALDKAFAALPEEYAEYVGTGSISDLSDPGHLGFRGAIYKAAKLEATDSLKQIAVKIEAAAKSIVGPRIKQVADTTSAYDKLPSRKPQPKDAVNGRFTKEDFEKGHVHKPGGKSTGVDPLDDVEQARRYFKEIGDPRGNHAGVSLDDDDLPG